jgi:hypothetical protein
MTTTKTGRQWAADLGVTILDPDGWRLADGVTLDDPITRLDFERRLIVSTIQMPAVY